MNRGIYCLILILTMFVNFQLISQEFIINKDSLDKYKTEKRTKELDNIITKASKIVQEDLSFSVTFDKTELPPSGRQNDYLSYSPYYYVKKNKKTGKLISFKKDGVANPDIYRNDKRQLIKLVKSLKYLTIAYYITDQVKYKNKAAELLNIWFVDENTKMNPHLKYGQMKPLENVGSPYGIIETRSLLIIPDLALILFEDKSSSMLNGLKVWFRDYVSWLKNSDLGIKASRRMNNHGTYYDLQISLFTAFSIDVKKGCELAVNSLKFRLDSQLDEKGRMKYELKRSHAYRYVNFNLKGLYLLSVLASNLDKKNNWFKYKQMDNKSLNGIFDWLESYLFNNRTWNFGTSSEITKDKKTFTRILYSNYITQVNGETVDDKVSGRKPYLFQLIYYY